MGEKLSREEEIKAESGSLSPSRLARLKDRKIRKELFITGKKAVSGLMVLYFQENRVGTPRYLVYASKKLGSAVQRNRVKRVFREALYSKKKELKAYDFIIVPREGAKTVRMHEAISHVGKILFDHGLLEKKIPPNPPLSKGNLSNGI
ncbi:MAG: ribonuclease P protein component [Nitrospirae bacterium]|nr:ribonuclease P protein component [Candidatus Troglogloeales bacterium]